MGFHRIVLRAGKVKSVGKDQIRILKSDSHIALLVAKMKTDIAVLVHDMRAAAAIARIAALQSFVHQRRAGFQRIVDGAYGGQLFIVNFDQIDRLLRGRAVHRRHRGDHVAGVAHFVGGDNLLIAHIGAKGIRGNLNGVAREHGEHARQSVGSTGVDAANARVGQRTAQHLGNGHPRQAHIAGVNRLAGNLVRAIDAADVLTDSCHGPTLLSVLLEDRCDRNAFTVVANDRAFALRPYGAGSAQSAE